VGSAFIFAVSVTGKIRAIPGDRPVHRQLLRPLFSMQAIFAGYLCLTSIFYVWSVMSEGGSTAGELQRLAAAQRYLVLGHAAFVTGILATMDYRASGRWQFRSSMSRAQLALSVGVGALLLAVLLGQFPGLGMFEGKLMDVAPVAAILSLVLALRDSEWFTALIGLAAFGYIAVTALFSGWMESVMLVAMVFLVFLYPHYRTTALGLGVVALVLMITVVPAYVDTFRSLNWNEGIQKEKAAEVAWTQLKEGAVDVRAAAWRFLSNRSTLIDHFTEYIEHTPKKHPYYGFEIVNRSIKIIIPRVLWPEKPITERVVMKRVYENGVVTSSSGASAKPQVIMDGYLSAGAAGVFLVCLVLGLVASGASRLCESWLGGYEIGGQIVYAPLFIGLVRTPSLEFLVNSVFWSFVLVVAVSLALREIGMLGRSAASATASIHGHRSPAPHPRNAAE